MKWTRRKLEASKKFINVFYEKDTWMAEWTILKNIP
jgi:hypothetical protein